MQVIWRDGVFECAKAAKTDSEVILYDERLTTVMSEAIIHEQGDNVLNAKNRIDAISACVILESFLRSNNDIKK